MSTTVDVLARLRADTTDFQAGMRRANQQVDSLQRNVSGVHGTVGKASGGLRGLSGAAAATGMAAGVAAAALGGLVFAASKFAGAAQESVAATRTVEAVIRATGGAAGVTTRQVQDLATALSNKTGIDDEAIMAGQRLILTFKNVQNAGSGQAAMFDRASTAALDLSRAGFGSIESASKMLGKALNDPERGLTALSRAGVTFTQQQKDQIAALVQSGQTLEAQKVIMAEVESQVSGVAEAARSPMEALQTAFGNLQETIGAGLLPVFDQLSRVLPPILEAIGPGLQQVAATIGTALMDAFKAMSPLIEPATQAFQALAEVFGTVLTTAIQNVVPVMTPLISLMAQVAQTLGPVIGSVLSAVTPLFQALGAVIAGLSPAVLALVQALAPVVQMLAGTLGQALSMLVPIVSDLATQVGQFLAQAFAVLAPYLQDLMNVVGSLVASVMPPLVGILRAVMGAVLPLLPTIAQLMGLVVSLAHPVLSLVAAFVPLLTIMSRLVVAVLDPLLRVLTPIIDAMLRWLLSVLEPIIPVIERGAKELGDMAATGVRGAASLLRSYAQFVDFLLNSVFKPIVDNAAKAFGWVPGIGSGIQAAAANFANFASSTIQNINGVASGLDGIANDLNALARGTTIPVTLAVSQGRVSADAAERRANPQITLPTFTPQTTPTTGVGASGGKSGPDYKGMLGTLREARATFQKMLGGMSQAVTGSVEDVKSYFQDLTKASGDAFKAALALAKNKAQRDRLMQRQNSMNERLRGLQDQLMENARRREALADQIEEAKAALQQAKEDRAAAAGYFRDLLNKPFGEPSQLDRALSATSVTVDGVLDLYSNLAEQVKKRFALLRDANGELLKGLNQDNAIRQRDAILERLKASTAQLIRLVKDRDRIAGELAKAQEKYQAILAEQQQFVSKVQSGFMDAFGGLGGLNDAAAFGGTDTVVQTLQTRLQTLRDYAANIEALRAKGLNADMLRQIVEAGPGQNQSLISSLLTAGPADIQAINQAQTQATALASQFATRMGAQWYGQAVNEAQAYMNGWQSQYNAVLASMEAVRASIEETLAPLADSMDELGFESAWAFIGGLESQQQRLLDIAAGIGQTMADAVVNGINAAIEAANAVARQVKAPLLSRVSAPRVTAPKANRTEKPQYKPPARALGGSVLAGMPYTVGERGRELFIPPQAGRVVSNRRTEQMLGGLSVTVEPGAVQVIASGADAGEVSAEVERAINEMFRRAAREASLARRG